MIKNPADIRTIIAATEPTRFRDTAIAIMLKVWFKELDEPVTMIATPLDSERHGKELWIRAMAGEYGPITVLPVDLAGRVPTMMIVGESAHLRLVSMDPGGKPYVELIGANDLPRLAAGEQLLIESGGHNA